MIACQALVFMTIPLFYPQPSSSYLSFKSNEDLAKSFGLRLNSKMQMFTGYEALISMYERRYAARDFTVHRRSGIKLVARFSSDLRKMLKKKQDALAKSVEVGEKAALAYNWTVTPTPDYNNVLYINAPSPKKGLKDEPDEYTNLRKSMKFQKSSRFRCKVNMNTSTVQVPFNVYSKNPELLKSVDWSKALNDQFKKNLRRDPSLKWQYFGSIGGYMRIYPGFQWKIVNQQGHLNLYDCRTRLWYTQAATYPKDMLILVDASGSMTGLRKSIAIHLVKTLLSTLGDNDFFNVLTFNKTTDVVEPCFNGTLVKADQINKEAVIQRLEHIATRDIANFDRAFHTALNYIINFQRNGSGGSGCNCAIMLITDGAPENYQWIFDQAATEKNVTIRIFAYLVGQEKNYLQPVKEMACNNKGFFTQVESPNSVTEQVLHHVNVINRPLALTGDHHTIWTKAYYDASGEQSLGLISTIASPVYKNSNQLSPSLIGVMAIDVPINDMLDAMPVNTVGVNGYIFIVTDNGYTMFHPRMKTNYQDIYDWAKINPNFMSLDIGSLDTALNFKELRTRMARLKEESSFKGKIITPLSDWKRIFISNGSYYFSPIATTPFFLGMVLPNSYGHANIKYSSELRTRRYDATYDEEHCTLIQKQLMANDATRLSRNAAICSLTLSKVSVPNQWRYCTSRNQDEMDMLLNTNQLDMIKLYLLGRDNGTIKCNDEIIDGVLFDVFLTAALHPIWSEFRQFQNSSRAGIELTFMVSKSGVIRRYWHEDVTEAYKTSRNNLFRFSRTQFPDLYRRTVSFQVGSWVYTLPFDDLPNNRFGRNIIVATTPIVQHNAILGVSGLFLNYSTFERLFWEESTMISNVDCSQKDNSGFDCFILDENGFVLLSRNHQNLGRFFGRLNSHVMLELVSYGSYKKIELVDYDAMCAPSRQYGEKSSSTRIHLPQIKSLLVYGVWWATQFLRNIVSLRIQNFLTVFSLFTASHVDATRNNSNQEFKYRSCHRKYDIYVANRTKFPHSGRIFCKNAMHVACEREFGVFNVMSSNLILVVVQSDPYMNLNCKCHNESVPVTPDKGIINNYLQDEKCNRIQENTKIVRTVRCVQQHIRETQLSLPCAINSNSASTLLPVWMRVYQATVQSLCSTCVLSLTTHFL